MFPQTLHVHGRGSPGILIERKPVHVPDHTHSAAPASPWWEGRWRGSQRARRGGGPLSAEEVIQERLLRLPRRCGGRLGRVVVVVVTLMMPERLRRDDAGRGAPERCP